MKPVKLHMKNIGPYRDETIDFTKLDTMFLIKGDTGAGKTFIFDSMTYALYGVLRGNRRGHESNFKSRYAEESEESFVELTFELAGKIYRIQRSVPFSYTNRNGKKVKKNQEASLEELQGGTFVPLQGKLTEINNKVCEIIGLSADEFSQIVVLPQGEFAEFLHQNTNERMKTLEKLFPVEFYAEITKRIKEKADSENEKLKTCANLIESISKGNDFSDADEKISRMKAEIESYDKKETEFLERRTELAKKIEGLKHEKSAAEEFEKNCRLLENLESQKKDFDLLGKIIIEADKAKGLREFIISLEIAENHLEKTTQNLKNAEHRKAELSEILKTLDEKKSGMQNLKVQNEKDGQELKILQEKIKSASELNSLKAQNKAAEQKRSEIEKRKNQLDLQKNELEKELGSKNSVEILNQIAGELQNLAEQKNLLEKEKSDCMTRDDLNQKKNDAEKLLEAAMSNQKIEEEKLDRAKKTLEELEAKVKESEEKHQAFTVSKFLKVGLPCPVCGSLEHPSPAQKPEGLLDYSEQIKTQKDSIDSIQKLIERYKTDFASENAKLEEFKNRLSQIETNRNIEEVQGELEKTVACISQKENERDKINSLSQKLVNLEKELKNAQELFEQANLSYSRTLTQIQTIEKSLGEPLEILSQKEIALASQLEKNRGEVERWEEKYDSISKEFAVAKSTAENLKQDEENYTRQTVQAKTMLDEKIALSDFKSVEEAKMAYLEDSVLEQKRKAQRKFAEDLRSVQDAVNAAKEKKLKSSDEISAALEQAGNESLKNESEFRENHRVRDEKTVYFTEYKSDFEKIRAAQDEKLRLEKEIEPLNALNNNLSGKNPQKLQLESWALGMYFEQVVDFASERFNDISDGRFFFKLRPPEDAAGGNGFRGLDLQVLDTHTGKMSDAAELSGGETFEASISLALAITDVVQNNNGGGIQLDALFIDEGFGTLDPEALEKAMSVLTELGESKMIGMISHVSEMENFSGINSSITVNKSNTGSTVTVV